MSKVTLKRPLFIYLFALLVVVLMGFGQTMHQTVDAYELRTMIPSFEPTLTPSTTSQVPITSYDTAIESSPQDAEAYLNRANAFFIMERMDAALDDYNRAIELNPHYAEAYFGRGFLFYKQAKYDKAIDDFTQTIELNSKYIEAYFFRGRSFAAQESLDLAIKDFTEVIHLNLDSKFTAASYYFRATALANQSKFDLALKDIDQALIINPKYDVAYALRGQIFDYQGKLTDALKNYQIFLKLAGGPVEPSMIDRVKELETILSNATPSISSGSSVDLTETFSSSDNSLNLKYPSGWFALSNDPYTVSIGNSAKTADTLANLLSPALSSGERGIVVYYISKNRPDTRDDIDLSGDPIKFLKTLLAHVPSTSKLGKFEMYTLGDLDTAKVILTTDGIESIVYAFFIGKTPVYVVGAAAPGELNLFQSTIEAVILSIQVDIPTTIATVT